MILRVGLTGGIGSGKSTVADMFAELGVAVIDADSIAHELTTPSEECFNLITEHFGEKILKKSGELNRSALRQIIFNDSNEKRWIEQLLHPRIRNIIKQKIAAVTTPYCIIVIPLLTESSSIDFVDRILVVDLAEEKQIERVKKRDQIDGAMVNTIMQSQSDRKKRLAMADDIIENDGHIEQLRYQINEMHQKYLKLLISTLE